MINFSNPLNGAKWLSLLEPHPSFGMLFKKNLKYERSYLGFSFQSNRFGLRGPENVHADTVICGTSYAMGLSVDNGKNWYELDPGYRRMFNIGMPIGFRQQLRLLEAHYRGSFQTLLFLYHPNLWVTNRNFHRAEENHTDIFTWMGWISAGARVYYLYLRWLLKERYKRATGQKLLLPYKGRTYHLDLRYSYFPPENRSEISTILEEFSALARNFRRVIVVRIPIKEEIAKRLVSHENLERLNENYRKMWEIFRSHIASNCEVVDLFDRFELTDYLEQDTHWSENGNEVFDRLIKEQTGILC